MSKWCISGHTGAQGPLLTEEFARRFNLIDKFDRDFFLQYWAYRRSSYETEQWDSLFHIIMVDAWVLYLNLANGRDISLRDFILDVAVALLT